MTEAVPLGELLHEEALFGLTSVSTPRTLIPVRTLPLRHISSSLGMARPFTNKVEKGWKKRTDTMVGGPKSITLYEVCTPSSVPSQGFSYILTCNDQLARWPEAIPLTSRRQRQLFEPFSVAVSLASVFPP